MNVNDLKENMDCTIISTKKDKKYESRSVIRKIERNTIYVDVVRYNGKVVNLSSTANHLAIDIKTHEPQIFQYILPEICRRDGRTYYRIDLKNRNSAKYNRRRNARCRIGKIVSARIDDGSETYQCVLKDISAIGFALEFKRSELPKDYRDIKLLRCIYAEVNKVHDIKLTADLKGAVKRTVITEDGHILFGCQMPYSYQVDHYVTRKLGKDR